MHDAYSTSHWHELSWERFLCVCVLFLFFFHQELFSAGNTLTKASMNTILLYFITSEWEWNQPLGVCPLQRLQNTSLPQNKREAWVDALHQTGSRGSPDQRPGILMRGLLLLCRRLTHSEARWVPQGSFTLGLGPPAGWECHRKMGGGAGILGL